jgi:hypothetical protein
MTPPPTGTLDAATLGPSGAFAVDADGLEEVAAAVGDGDAGAEVSAAVGVAGGEPLDASAQAPSAAAPAPVRPRSPAARKMVRRVVADISGRGVLVAELEHQKFPLSALRASVARAVPKAAVMTLFRRQTR